MTALDVLYVEDDEVDAELIERELGAHFDARVRRVDTEDAFVRELRDPPDLVLSDYALPEFSGLRALQLRNEHARGIPLIVVSGAIGEERAAEVIRLGADDFVDKSRLPRLVPAVERVLREHVSDRRRRDAESRFQAIVAALPDVILRCDRTGEIRYASPGVMDMFGYRDTEFVLDSALLERVTESTLTQPTYHATPSGTPAMVRQRRVRRRDGTPRLLEERVVAIDGEHGASEHLVLLRDITDQEQLESQLEQSQRMDALGRLAGGIAHDFNNLLTSVIGYVDLAAARVDDDEVIADLDSALLAADRAAQLSQQLLTFSQADVRPPTLVDIRTVIENVLRLVRPTIDAAGIELHATVDDGVGSVIGNETQVEQAILNLVLNASDATRAGGRLDVRAELRLPHEIPARMDIKGAPSAVVDISVSDNGSGMDEATLAHALEPFFTTKAKGHGSGLGLSTAYGTINQAGGDLRIETEVGVGTTVHAVLPLAETRPAEAAALTNGQPVGDCGARGTILLVEDTLSVRRLTGRMLASLGFGVVFAANGAEALEIMGRGTPVDIMLTDIVMPEIGGFELAELARARIPHLPILFMSGFASEGERGVRESLLQADPTRFIAKPFTRGTLLGALNALVEQRDTAQ